MAGSRGLRERILAWYGGTVLAVLGLVILLVHIRVSGESNHQVAVQMDTARRVVQTFQHERLTALAMVARLAGDEPRLHAAMTPDRETGLAADARTLEDLLRHDLQPLFEADFLGVTDGRGQVLAATSDRWHPGSNLSGDPGVRAALAGDPDPAYGLLIMPREIDLVATARIQVGGQQLGTVTIGRRVSNEMAGQMRWNTRSEVSFFSGHYLAATSWPRSDRGALLDSVRSAGASRLDTNAARTFPISMAGQRWMCRLIPLTGQDGRRGWLLIQSSLDAALRPVTNIQQAVAVIGLIGLLIAILGSVVVARGVTTPLERIAHAALGLMQGDWSQRAPVLSRDEVGLLAETFNRMAERLESWDTDMRAAVAERTQELNTAVRQLDAAYQQMRQFNADASHELRTPLTVIRGEAEVALRAARTVPEYQTILQTIQDETERMSRIIEQLLLLARADSGELKLERRPVALDDLIREVVHRAEVLAAARPIQLRTKGLEPLWLEGDEDRLRQLVLNLVDNAIKYTPPGGDVCVRLRLQTDPGGAAPRAVVEIEDTGIGIEPASLPRIFDRFYRIDKARSRAEGGSGLGLAICRWIVEAHGGQIDVRSQVGIGSCFMVVLPGVVTPPLEELPPEAEDAEELVSRSDHPEQPGESPSRSGPSESQPTAKTLG